MRDWNTATTSLRSVLKAAENLSDLEPRRPTIWLCHDETLNTQFLEELPKICAEHEGLSVKFVAAGGLSYFAAKNLALTHGVASRIVFCDSDCTYEPDFLIKFKLAFEKHPNSVIYGQTFAATPSSVNQTASSLSWLFPPEEIGYGDSWPNSKWANNFGLKRETFERYPFQTISIQYFPYIESKHERPLWEKRLESDGIDSVQIEAKAFHLQFSTIRSWLSRQWVHGIGTASRLQLKGKKLASMIRLTQRPIDSRIVQLRALRLPHFAQEVILKRAFYWLRLASLVRAIASLVVFVVRPKWDIEVTTSQSVPPGL